jgi:hypothetical protein
VVFITGWPKPCYGPFVTVAPLVWSVCTGVV